MTTRTMAFQIPNELQRTEAIARTQPAPVNPLRQVAQAITRRGVMEAKVEIANNALLALVDVLFDVDKDNATANIDDDGHILIPLPWGRSGYAVWGLRVTEMRCLNHIMRTRSNFEGAPLFVYDADTRRWYTGGGYGKQMALSYLRTTPITLKEWRAAWRAVRSTWASKNMGQD